MDADIIRERIPDSLTGAPESTYCYIWEQILTFAYRPYREVIGSSQEILDLAISSCPGTFTVFTGKVCRSAQALISSCWGKHIVLPGKVYRLSGESISSASGNIQQFFLQMYAFASGRDQEFCTCLC